MTRRYKAFISYSWADRTWGEWLHRTLETYRAPKGVADGQSLHPIFKDREEEAAGGSVGAAIEAALGASEFLIVICSPRSAQSTWVNREVAWFKTHKDKANILALIVDGEPGASAIPGREAEECFPKTLTRKVGADLQPTEEWEDAPLAADARAEGDGRRGAKLKLAAALLGVGLDALVRRDERRRTIRRRAVTSAGFGLAAMLGGLAIYAFTQRDAAVVARNEAVKARDDAEGIIELILTDLKSDLEGFGTLKSVTQIGNRAIGYYEGQDVKALTPDQLGRRARVLLMLGEADNNRGDLSAALARYETAAATTEEQLARDPENPQRMFDHAQSVFWVGYIAWQRGDREKAKRQFTEYHDLAQALVASDPANEDWQAELDYAYSNLGTLAMDEGNAAAAEGYFRKSLEIALRRLEATPDEADRMFSAGQAYAWLADAHYFNKEIAKAADVRRKESELYVRAMQAGRNRADVAESFAVSKYSTAIAELSLGKIEDAERAAFEAVTVFDDLAVANFDNVRITERTAYAQTVLAELMIFKGQVERAKNALTKGASMIDALIAKDKQVSNWRGTIRAQTQILIAQIESKNDPVAALSMLSDVERDLAALRDNGNQDPDVTRRYCEAVAARARLTQESTAAWYDVIGRRP